ncbi:DUF2325 domain-containing protein [Salinispira pacifica]|uniref:Membrane protein involved in colicin uptake n=1 Tax=Salinispira pacifica TaxID=1307761 RepID=V5WEH4_9SPIO|nr:DUF2325 domain-containing protein [Salinispira pacifica]AHC14015.1 Membrane protein involved in colicin uptake [Salinispira pacifica]
MKAKRRKMSQIDSDLYCSIVGTCFTCDQVRHLLLEETDAPVKDQPDYVVHEVAVASLRRNERFRNRTAAYLDRLYSREVYAVSKLSSKADLDAYWDERFASGSISGAYWALFTHGHAGNEILTRVFGMVHMQGHESAREEQERRKEVERLHHQIHVIEEDSVRTRLELDKTTTKLRQLESALRIAKKKQNELKRQVVLHCSEIASLEKSDPVLTTRENEKLVKAVEMLNAQNQRLREEIKVLRIAQVGNNQSTFSMESERSDEWPAPNIDCPQECEFRDSCNLDAKSVLLVGGKMSMVPHCRRFIESYNGCFAYHDGGKEQSLHVLKSMVAGADIVVCALDCVSHSAVKGVKNQCRGNSKRLVLLPNSGVTSFQREMIKMNQ